MISGADRPIVWVIDENTHELRTNRNILNRLMSPTLEIKEIEAYGHLSDYLALLTNPRTACIITDQKLKVRGTANYTGIELAEFLRGINPKLPIYILTNFADDRDEFIGGEWSVEEIIRKSDLGDEEAKRILKARILRRINVYEDIGNERTEKIHDLLIKSMNGEINEMEAEELQELRLQKMAPQLAEELARIQQMEQVFRIHEDFMRRFEHLAPGETKNV